MTIRSLGPRRVVVCVGAWCDSVGDQAVVLRGLCDDLDRLARSHSGCRVPWGRTIAAG